MIDDFYAFIALFAVGFFTICIVIVFVISHSKKTTSTQIKLPKKQTKSTYKRVSQKITKFSIGGFTSNRGYIKKNYSKLYKEQINKHKKFKSKPSIPNTEGDSINRGNATKFIRSTTTITAKRKQPIYTKYQSAKLYEWSKYRDEVIVNFTPISDFYKNLFR